MHRLRESEMSEEQDSWKEVSQKAQPNNSSFIDKIKDVGSIKFVSNFTFQK